MIEFILENAAMIATVGFFLAFLGIAFFALSKKNKKRFEDYSKIALRDE